LRTQVVSPEEWLTARLDLLAKEKEHTRNADKLASLRADMPLVKVTTDYSFTGPGGKTLSLLDLFEDRQQLIIYHFMFDPSWDAGCSGCSFLADNIPLTLSHLNTRDTTLVVVSRAPIEKIEGFKSRMGWSHIPWYSSYGSDFNYDFHTTQDEAKRAVSYNYMDKKTLTDKGWEVFTKGEQPGFSVFWNCKNTKQVYHTYSAYSRGIDHLLMTTGLLDFTPLGRQDGGKKGGKDFKYHDQYTEEDLKG
jgi:predicted dithiol-disulfide oxidoreductase (DUF899 family)